MTQRYTVLDIPNGSVLRIEPVKSVSFSHTLHPHLHSLALPPFVLYVISAESSSRNATLPEHNLRAIADSAFYALSLGH